MTRPGARLRSLAARVCGTATMERLIDPAIADLQSEYGEAIRRGQVWRSRRVLLAGYLGFWRAVGMHAGRWSFRAIGDWAAADHWVLGRTVGFSLCAIAALILFQDLPGLLRFGPRLEGRTGAFVLYLVALSLPAAVTFGLPIGILCALRGRGTTARVRRAIFAIAIVGSLVVFAEMAWVFPAANHALAVLVNGHPVGKALNALTLQELSTRIDVLTERGLLSEARTAALAYHARWAAPFMTLVVSLFALGVAAVSRGRSRSIAIGLAATVSTLVYGMLFMNEFGASVPALALVWAPVPAFGAIAAALLACASSCTPEYSR